MNNHAIHLPQRRLTLTIVLPAIVYYLVFRYYPVGRTLFLSLTDANLLDPQYNFVGLKNFQILLTDPEFLQIIWNTAYYAIVTTVVTTLLALVLAFLFEAIQRGGGLLRLIYFLPTITSAISIATIWIWLYQPRFGFFNQALRSFGLAPIAWLNSVQWAMPSLIVMSIWGGVGFATIIFVAGLYGIPDAYAEAAVIDGASALQIARLIKLPLLSRVITFNFVTGIIGSFQVFQQVYLMTHGGPLNATRVIALQIYDYAFQRLQIGQAASMAFVLFMIVGLLTVIQLRMQRQNWEL
ncbi:sugar ABC transporter permease [soil metagenome]